MSYPPDPRDSYRDRLTFGLLAASTILLYTLLSLFQSSSYHPPIR